MELSDSLMVLFSPSDNTVEMCTVGAMLELDNDNQEY